MHTYKDIDSNACTRHCAIDCWNNDEELGVERQKAMATGAAHKMEGRTQKMEAEKKEAAMPHPCFLLLFLLLASSSFQALNLDITYLNQIC